MKHRVIGVALAVATAIAVLLGWRALTRPSSDHGRLLKRLVESSVELEHRPFDVRISGGFPYRPSWPATRGSNTDAGVASHWKQVGAGAELQEAALHVPNAENLHAFGVSQLVLRRSTAAVETLEAALFRETGQNEVMPAVAKSSDAVLLSDLAAAYFVRSQTVHHARDLMAAAECAARARRLDTQNSEAAWNRAVIFEAIGVVDVVRTAWSDYLRLDSTSEWAVEARDRLRAASVPALAQRWEVDRQQLLDAAAAGSVETVNVLVQRYPEQARTLVEEDLLGQWAMARQGGDEGKAESALAQARVVAESVGRLSHDFLARDATAVISRSAPKAIPFLVRGYQTYLAARRLYKSGQHPQAEPMLAAAASDLEQGGSPLAFRAHAYDITSKDYLGRPADAIGEGRKLLQKLGSAAASFPTVTGMLHWTCGLAAMDLGSLDEALEHHRAALAAFQLTEETSNLAGVVQMISADYRAVGDLDNAWLYQIQSFQLASRYASFERTHVVVSGGALEAVTDGYVTVADELQSGVLARARAAHRPEFACSALVRRTETLVATGHADEARATALEALRVWKVLPETAMKSRLRADLEMARATITSGSSPQERIAELNQSVEFVSKTNSRSRVARVMLLRARAHRDAGDESSAERDLAAGIAEVEAQREKTRNDESRLTFLNTAPELYDEAIRIQLRRGEGVAAFDLLERRRARWLLDRFQGEGGLDAGRIETWNVLRGRIPSGVSIVSFAVSGQVDAWIATTSSLKHVPLGDVSSALRRQIAALQEALSTGKADAANRLEESLYDVLIQPLRPDLNAARALVVLPDRYLNALPFSALRDRRSGRYLIEDFAISFAPSANLYVSCLDRSRSPVKEGAALIVANPALAAGEESLRPLAAADGEATAIASQVSSPRILRGTEATVDRFVKSAADAKLIHFAGHAVVNLLRPELSSLVLAPNPEGGGSRLYARDIYRMHLPRTRLVVLAACESAAGRITGDSPLSLGTSFIAAGVPTVIASLWPVEDGASAVLFRELYRKLRGGMSPAEALRDEQIAAIRSGKIGSETWAAYEVIGSPGCNSAGDRRARCPENYW